LYLGVAAQAPSLEHEVTVLQRFNDLSNGGCFLSTYRVIMELKKPPDVCVFHLVWAPFGLGTFEEFVASYRANPAELPHRLRIIFNGFMPGFDYAPYRTLLDGLEYDSLTTVQAVQDLATSRLPRVWILRLSVS
jgi:hypothetical protein